MLHNVPILTLSNLRNNKRIKTEQKTSSIISRQVNKDRLSINNETYPNSQSITFITNIPKITPVIKPPQRSNRLTILQTIKRLDIKNHSTNLKRQWCQVITILDLNYDVKRFFHVND